MLFFIVCKPVQRFSTVVLRLRKLCVVERFASLHIAVSDEDEPEPEPRPPEPAVDVGAADPEPEEPEAVAVGTVTDPDATAPEPVRRHDKNVLDNDMDRNSVIAGTTRYWKW